MSAPAVFENARTQREQRWQQRHELAAASETENRSTIVGMESPEGRTDTANAKRLVEQYGNKIRWVTRWQKFLTWNERHWTLNETELQKFAVECANEQWTTLALMPKSDLDQSQLRQMVSFIRASNSKSGIQSAQHLARSEDGIPIEFSELDQKPMLFNVANGTVDLQTGKLRPHDPNDYLTKISPVNFDPAAQCPTWIKFLLEVFDQDCNLIEFIARAVGYSLTGLIHEHVLWFLFGTGANGKTTFQSTLQYIWGDYAVTVRSDLLMITRAEHPTEFSDLCGARLAIANETEQGRRLAEVTIKWLTGGDTLKARRMREDFWQFRPTHKLWLSGNHKPRIIGTDEAIWRRVAVVPFTQQFLTNADPLLPEKLKAEASGILNWAIKGCLDWQRHGLEKPAVVQDATNEYRNEEDLIGQFLADCCAMNENSRAGATDLYECYERWGGELNQTKFGRSLAERGFISERASSGISKGRKAWRGIELLGEGLA